MKTYTAFNRLQGATSQRAFSALLVILRIMIGLQFFIVGITKLTSEWTAEGYLLGATGPFAEWFQGMAGSGLISFLNVWGLIFIGLGLILGLMVRPASFFGALLMTLYYLAHFEQNTAHGIIDFHLVYVAIFGLFMAGGVGRVFGLDSLVWGKIQWKSARTFLFG